MKPVYHAWDLGMLDPETVEVMKSSKQVFNRNMARYLLGEMTTIFVEHGAVNLDCMYELSRMTLDDAKYFLSESPKVESGDLPVAKCFMECAGDTMAKRSLCTFKESPGPISATEHI